MDVLDLTGPKFLGFYSVSLLAAVAVGLLVRAVLRSAAGSAIPLHYTPDPFEVAYLRGGPRGVAGAAIAALVQRGAARIESSTGQVRPDDPLHPRATAVEVDAHAALRSGHTTTRAVARAIEHGATARIAARLRDLQFVPTAGETTTMRVLSAAAPLLVFAVGLAKVFVGVARGRPVEFLAGALVVTGIVCLVFLAKPPRVTTAGKRVLKTLAARESALRATAGSPAGATLAPADAAMAMALFGPAVFAAGPLADVRRAVSRSDSGTGCGGGSSCSGGGDGGGGGGGCGGCGGGGD